MAGYITGRANHRDFSKDPRLAPLIDALPGITEALAADADAEARLAEVAESPVAVTDSIDTMIANGRVDRDELTAYAEARMNAARAENEQALLREVRARASSKIESTVTNSTTVLLTQLDRDLQTCLESLRPSVTQLNGITRADQAIDSGPATVEAWTTLTSGRKEYDEIRTAQTLLMTRLHEQVWQRASRVTAREHDPIASDALISDLDTVWPTWRATKAADQPGARTDPAGVIQRESISGRRMNGAPWPEDAIPQLAWLITHARLWVPTVRQLEDLWDERADRDREKAQELAKAAKSGSKQSEKRLGHSERAIGDWHALTGG